MKIIKEYIDYLKDNPKKVWFKRKLYGWGWTPATWQGWLVIAVFVAYLIWNSIILDSSSNPTASEIKWFFAKIVLSVVLIILICYKKGEKPRWQWGRSEEKSNTINQ